MVLASRGLPITFNSRRDGRSQFVAMGRLADQFDVGGVGEESALDQHAGARQVFQHLKPRPLHAALGRARSRHEPG